MGQKKGTDGGGFWAADGTGYGHGLEEKLKGKQRKKKGKEEGRKENKKRQSNSGNRVSLAGGEATCRLDPQRTPSLSHHSGY